MAFTHVNVRMQFLMGTSTWSEAFYRASSAINTGTIDAAKLLVEKRRYPLSQAARIVYVRITAVEQKRLSRKIRIAAGAGLHSGNRDVAAVSRVVPLYADNGSRRDYQMLGNPDSVIEFDPNGNEIPPFGPTTQAYLDYLSNTSNGWQMQVLTTPASADGLVPISAISVAGGVVTFQAPNLTLSSGQKFVISGCDGFKVSQFNGAWRCSAYADPVLSANSSRYIDSQFFYVGGSGRIRPVTNTFYTYEQIASYDLDNVRGGTRKVGRPIV